MHLDGRIHRTAEVRRPTTQRCYYLLGDQQLVESREVVTDRAGVDRRKGVEEASTDLTMFDLTEIERRPEEKVWDVPDGQGGRTYRYTRAPAPMRLTLVTAWQPLTMER
jgi:hypothetical protein